MMVVGMVRCPECEAEIGRIVNYKGRPYFDDGIMLVLVGLRRCHCCGRVFHWNGEAMGLEKAISVYGNGNGHKTLRAVEAW